MKAAVCIKQIPTVSDIGLEAGTNRMLRDGVPSEINPADKNALEEALKLADEVTVLTMGPDGAQDALRECLEMGADQAVLVGDCQFAGSDTLATARILAAAIKKTGPYDMVFTGRKAADGDTGQVGPALAQRLNLPLVSAVRQAAADTEAGTATARREVTNGYEIVETPLPVLMTVCLQANEPRKATIKSKMKAAKTEITRLDAAALGLAADQTGLNGSATAVVDVFAPEVLPVGEIIETKDPDDAASKIMSFIEAAKLV